MPGQQSCAGLQACITDLHQPWWLKLLVAQATSSLRGGIAASRLGSLQAGNMHAEKVTCCPMNCTTDQALQVWVCSAAAHFARGSHTIASHM